MDALIPGLDAIQGFEVAEVESHPLNIAELDAESTPIMPLTERSWTVHLTPAAVSQASFRFPSIALANEASTRKRYDDLDLVDAESTVAWMLRSSRRPLLETSVPLPLPSKVTPLSALAYLRRLSEAARLRERPEWGAELASEVAGLERQAFAPGGEQPSESELRGVLQRWRDRAVA
jgi:hypothetical protein